MSAADEAEVERMIEAGALDPLATRSALELMAGRWLAEVVRKRERAGSKRGERRAQRRDRSAEALGLARGASRDMGASLEVDWPELFDETFALPDGSRVTWGEATAAEHEARASSLEVMAAGDLEAAAMHRAAAALIASRPRAATLRDAAT